LGEGGVHAKGFGDNGVEEGERGERRPIGWRAWWDGDGRRNFGVQRALDLWVLGEVVEGVD